ncbi:MULTISPECIES: ABC transporter substrate-binding protein [Nocardiopsis]|uniref:ABC transporter substrate-binding protein n=1 Tax=Nocardiopsis sinuspersici TaxID=501010 RepID=A0A1V3BY11_9ACTN|nr:MULTISPECIES: ABC transporter substrate-binding protein [Nocardiopsis]OOC53335.1 ABC transporter substrate-binding protein [Nocardiopsis sinuspersici]
MDTAPVRGGTLRYFGPGGMDHMDPACAYYAFSHQIIRLFARQLFSYPTALDESALSPAPDVAREMPTTGNGGVSADGRTYTIRLRPGVLWDTEPAREVTAADFVRGLKRLCNPVAGAGALTYFTSTIDGMAEFERGYREAVAGTPATPVALARYQEEHDIRGLRAVDDRTLVIELRQPANDLVNILATTFASAAPAEYDAFLPDSPEFVAGIRSNGPYRLTAYERGDSLVMERNPVWRQETDPLRHQYVDGIDVRMRRVSDDEVRRAVQEGGADLSWGAPVINPDRVVPDGDRRVGYAMNPYLVFNMRGPNAGGALRDLRVRRAIAHAIDKAAMVRLFDDMDLGTVTQTAHTAIPPGNIGHRPPAPRPVPGDRGSPERARALLAESGRDRFTLRLLYREETPHRDIGERLAADLARVGIDTELRMIRHADEYYRILQDPARAEAGEWDLTAAAWTPDWFGNNGRTCVQPLFQSHFAVGTANYGGYRDAEVDRLIEEALSEPSPERAEELWHRVDRKVVEDAAIVPILVCEPTIPHIMSDRVRNAIPLPHVDRWYDASHIWLARPDGAEPPSGRAPRPASRVQR